MLKSFVITIQDNLRSEEAAEKLIMSGKPHGVYPAKWKAITPKNGIYELAEQYGIDHKLFDESFSRKDNCLAAFLSHYSLWKLAVKLDEPIAIFEHDAYIISPLPQTLPALVGSLGVPSYGKFNIPTHLGWGPLTSKTYFPGAHAYVVTPLGASMLIDKASTSAAPTDLFLSTANFPWLQEFAPWPVECRDTFTTIQNVKGCLAKHNYGTGYDICEA